jgi:hypothetical protein
MSGVLRGFPPSTYLKYASVENPCACPVKCEAYFTGAALLIDPDFIIWPSFMNWKLISAQIYL